MSHCGALTKRGTPCRNSKYCHLHSQTQAKEGDGLRDIYNSVRDRIDYARQGERKGPTKRFDKFLSTVGEESITKIQIARHPINSGVKRVMDLLSGGRFSAKAKSLGYNDVFHNYLVVSTASGKTYKVEKNHVVEAKEATSSDLKHERYSLPLPTGTFKDLVERTDSKDPTLWTYDSRGDNCQRFTQRLIESNGLSPADPRAQEVVKPQDAEALVSSLGILQHIPKIVTATAAIADRIVSGDGMRRRAGLSGLRITPGMELVIG
jgi:hypothetical protein